MNPIFAGILLNSALYLGGCFAAGLWVGNGYAWRLALAAMGATYVVYFLQALDPRPQEPVILGAVSVSIGLGIIAGLALLF